jgi:hypothetical protein
MVQKLTNEMIGVTEKEMSIPYKTKMSLSLFMGQPLDSTMTPQFIQATQMLLSRFRLNSPLLRLRTRSIR